MLWSSHVSSIFQRGEHVLPSATWCAFIGFGQNAGRNQSNFFAFEKFASDVRLTGNCLQMI
jgi:hypothetical protein